MRLASQTRVERVSRTRGARANRSQTKAHRLCKHESRLFKHRTHVARESAREREQLERTSVCWRENWIDSFALLPLSADKMPLIIRFATQQPSQQQQRICISIPSLSLAPQSLEERTASLAACVSDPGLSAVADAGASVASDSSSDSK